MKGISNSFSRTICALIIGLVLVMFPNEAGDYFVITIGVVFLIPALLSIIGYFAMSAEERRRLPIEGIGSLLFGLWLIIMPGFFADLLTFVLGFILVLGGVQQIASLSAARRCAACVGDYRLDRQMVLFGLENLLEHWDVPMGVKTAEHAPSTFRRKEFSFEKLGEQWQEFCKKISENGENFAAFLQTVPAVEVRERMLILKLSSAFYADWVMEPGNRECLKNIISYYADVPVGFQIQVALADEVREPDKDAMEKMGRRLK